MTEPIDPIFRHAGERDGADGAARRPAPLTLVSLLALAGLAAAMALFIATQHRGWLAVIAIALFALASNPMPARPQARTRSALFLLGAFTSLGIGAIFWGVPMVRGAAADDGYLFLLCLGLAAAPVPFLRGPETAR